MTVSATTDPRRRVCHACGCHKLSAQELFILKRRFVVRNPGTHSFKEIGREVGLDKSRVAKVFDRALKKIEAATNHMIDPVREGQP